MSNVKKPAKSKPKLVKEYFFNDKISDIYTINKYKCKNGIVIALNIW